MPWLLERKFWPSVSRIDDGSFSFPIGLQKSLTQRFITAYGDLNLIVSFKRLLVRIFPDHHLQCDCPTVEESAEPDL